MTRTPPGPGPTDRLAASLSTVCRCWVVASGLILGGWLTARVSYWLRQKSSVVAGRCGGGPAHCGPFGIFHLKLSLKLFTHASCNLQVPESRKFDYMLGPVQTPAQLRGRRGRRTRGPRKCLFTLYSMIS